MRDSFSRLRQLEHHIDDSVRLYENVQADDYPAHWNNAFEVILPLEGEYTVCVGDDTYVVHPEEVIIIPAGAVHELFAPPAGRRYILMIDPSEFYTVDGLAAVQHSFYPCVHLRLDRDYDILREVHSYLIQTVREYQGQRTFDRAAVRLWLGLALLKTARYLLEERGDEAGDQHRSQATAVFLDVCSYITEHCGEKLTLDMMAQYSGYSKYHFSRMFKVYSGMSFYEFYLRQRIFLCEKLLADPALSITEVAMRAGFGSIATFNRIFKQYKQITPSEYRRLCQGSPSQSAIIEK